MGEIYQTLRSVSDQGAMLSSLYQMLRSVSDKHVFLICGVDGAFADLPDHVRHQGPWQVLRRCEVEKLNPDYWIDLGEHGYALVRCELAVFRPEA